MRKTSSLAASLSLLAILGLTALTSWAQLPTATLNGIVTDPQGALLPGAKVTLTSQATGLSREVTSSADGLYVFASLAAGFYDVRVEASGFAAKEHKDIRLEVGRAATLDVSLEVAPVGQVVTVEGGAATIELTQSQVQGQITATTLENIPLNGRNFLELAFLIPGNRSAVNYDPTKTNTLEVSSAGNFGRGGNISVDGGDNNDDVVGGTLMNFPQDAVQEFQISTNRYTAEVGRSSASVINIATKSGANDYHGSAFFFFRHRELQARAATLDPAQPTPSFDREQIGGSIGGPIKRDKAWWFFSFENRNQDAAIQVGERDFAAGRVVSSAALSPLDDFLLLGRVDLKYSDRDLMFWRYAFNRSLEITNGSLFASPLGSPANRQSSLNRFNSLLYNWTRTISPTKVNTFIFHINTFLNEIPAFSDNLPTTNPDLGLDAMLAFPGIQDGFNFRIPQRTRFDRFQVRDTFSWVRGNHTLRFGGEWQKQLADAVFDLFGCGSDPVTSGCIILTEDFPTLDRNGDGLTDDRDIPISFVIRSVAPERPPFVPTLDSSYLAFYVQDDWRARPNLTFNLGLRWELDTDVFGEGNEHEACPEPLTLAPTESCVWLRGVLGLNRSRGFRNLAPRIGFAWDPFKTGKTVIRGGYGIYYDRVILELKLLERLLDGRIIAVDALAGSTCGGGLPCGPGMTFDPGTPTLANPLAGGPGPVAIGINVMDNDIAHPYAQQWTLGIQHEIAPNWVISADGVHNFATRLLIGHILFCGQFPLAPPTVTCSGPFLQVTDPLTGRSDNIINNESSAKSYYDGLLVSLQKRPTRLGRIGYSFQLNYTLSKTLNYSNDDQLPFRETRQAGAVLGVNNLRLEKGYASNDERHRFILFGVFEFPYDVTVSPILTVSSSLPMDSSVAGLAGGARLPIIPRNALGRDINSGAELNEFITQWNTLFVPAGFGPALPLVDPNLDFGDPFSSLDVRVTKAFTWRERHRFELIGEVFNLFNITNIRGFDRFNISGFNNVINSPDFNRPILTAGGFFGSGGARAFQFAFRYSF